MVQLSVISSVLLLAASAVIAHPSTSKMSPAELQRRAEFQTFASRSLSGCQDSLRRRGHYERSAARRKALADELRRKRGISTRTPYKRSLDSVLGTSHLSNQTGLEAESDPFDGTGSCTLVPEATQGPYWVDGEYVRKDIHEDQAGLYTYVDLELIDYSTCETVAADIYVDIWHCNATGVYSGVVASGNGDSGVGENLNATFLRGIQPTTEGGYVQFETIFPGHYTGRTPHIHVLAHGDGTAFDNGTFKTSMDRHVGQVYFDQDLITAVEETSPYNTNTQSFTTNAQDGILGQAAADIDPVLSYVYLGDDITDGLLAWGSMGIDLSASYVVQSAATLTENGGVANGGFGGGGPGGAFPGNETTPGGATTTLVCTVVS
ncbi:aromatic compound dioxygenase [Desarmillaria tabescens]|uniref:Aromatic compound dioxygenase n=1 Tax=Armillaria tabescens TaxID=1929756 RepID=A0AA39N8L5_ARMTA|nr:aromatic compound dioxygenase [Desarmillaria tabescens]KAK0461033.1 aromatic compound dioxygenase [Desarmillaria tabescens]